MRVASASLLCGVVILIGVGWIFVRLLGPTLKPADWIGAAGSIAGSLIGALAAAWVVIYTLERQRKDEIQRIAEAIQTEVQGFVRLIIGNLAICESIATGGTQTPLSAFMHVVRLPEPIVYPAVADKLGRLRNPDRIVSFFTRLHAPAIAARMLSRVQRPTSPNVMAGDIEPLIEAWRCEIELGNRIDEELAVESKQRGR